MSLSEGVLWTLHRSVMLLSKADLKIIGFPKEKMKGVVYIYEYDAWLDVSCFAPLILYFSANGLYMNDKIIDEILKDVSASLKYSMKDEEDFNTQNDFISYREHLSLMCDNNWLLFKPFSNEGTLLLSVFGKSVSENGGWLKHLQIIKQKDDLGKIRQALIDEKLSYDVKNAKRIFKTYWWTFWFSVIALVISLVLLVLKLFE